MKKGKLYEIHWIDILQDADQWHEESDMEEFQKKASPMFTNCGYYYGSNKDYHMFYSGKSELGIYFDCVRIPKLVIKKIIAK